VFGFVVPAAKSNRERGTKRCPIFGRGERTAISLEKKKNIGTEKEGMTLAIRPGTKDVHLGGKKGAEGEGRSVFVEKKKRWNTMNDRVIRVKKKKKGKGGS